MRLHPGALPGTHHRTGYGQSSQTVAHLSRGFHHGQYPHENETIRGPHVPSLEWEPLTSTPATRPDDGNYGFTIRPPPLLPSDYSHYHHPPSTMRQHDVSLLSGLASTGSAHFLPPQPAATNAQVDQRGMFGHDQVSSQTHHPQPGYPSYDPTSPASHEWYPVLPDESAVTPQLPLSLTHSDNHILLRPRVEQVHAYADDSYIVPEPAHVHGSIHSLQALLERNSYKNSVEKGAASLLLEFYKGRTAKWNKWKEGLPQEPKGQRKGSRAPPSNDNVSTDSICARIDSGIRVIDLSEVMLNRLDTILLKIRKEAGCKKGEALLRSLVKCYAGNVEGSLSVVIGRVFDELERGTSFLTLDEGTQPDLPSGSRNASRSDPSTSRSIQSNSAAVTGSPNPQQTCGKSLLIQRASSAQHPGSKNTKSKRKDLRLGVYNDGDGNSVDTEDTSQNVLVKLASYLLAGPPSYRCFAWYVLLSPVFVASANVTFPANHPVILVCSQVQRIFCLLQGSRQGQRQ